MKVDRSPGVELALEFNINIGTGGEYRKPPASSGSSLPLAIQRTTLV